MTYDPNNITTWSDRGVLDRIDAIRCRLVTETQEDVRIMLGLQLEDAYADVRRRNRLRIEAIAAVRMQ